MLVKKSSLSRNKKREKETADPLSATNLIEIVNSLFCNIFLLQLIMQGPVKLL